MSTQIQGLLRRTIGILDSTLKPGVAVPLVRHAGPVLYRLLESSGDERLREASEALKPLVATEQGIASADNLVSIEQLDPTAIEKVRLALRSANAYDRLTLDQLGKVLPEALGSVDENRFRNRIYGALAVHEGALYYLKWDHESPGVMFSTASTGYVGVVLGGIQAYLLSQAMYLMMKNKNPDFNPSDYQINIKLVAGVYAGEHYGIKLWPRRRKVTIVDSNGSTLADARLKSNTIVLPSAEAMPDLHERNARNIRTLESCVSFGSDNYYGVHAGAYVVAGTRTLFGRHPDTNLASTIAGDVGSFWATAIAMSGGNLHSGYEFPLASCLDNPADFQPRSPTLLPVTPERVISFTQIPAIDLNAPTGLSRVPIDVVTMKSDGQPLHIKRYFCVPHPSSATKIHPRFAPTLTLLRSWAGIATQEELEALPQGLLTDNPNSK